MTDILVHTEAGVLTATFNRLEKKNSISSAMYAQLAEALARARDDASVRAMVIQGHESVFTAGNDLSDFQNAPKERGADDDVPVLRFLRTIAAFPKPLVASVCGPAVGVGVTMLLHCDLVYAGDNAAFSLPFVNLGLCPEAASSLLLPQLLGYRRAAEALLLGEPFSAEAALEMGLVNKVLPPGEANAYAQQIAVRLAAKPRSSLAVTKRLMKQDQEAAVLARMREEGGHFLRMLQEGAAREAFTAFMQKRKPDFSAF